MANLGAIMTNTRVPAADSPALRITFGIRPVFRGITYMKKLKARLNDSMNAGIYFPFAAAPAPVPMLIRHKNTTGNVSKM